MIIKATVGVSNLQGQVRRSHLTYYNYPDPLLFQKILRDLNVNMEQKTLEVMAHKLHTEFHPRPKLVIATGNQHKLREILAIYGEREPLELVSLAEAGLREPEETENTLEGNAILKAVTAARSSYLPCVSDDSGIFVSALGGLPGVQTAYYGPPGSGVRGSRDRILSDMLEFPEQSKRGAVFSTVTAFADVNGTLGERVLWVKVDVSGYVAREIPFSVNETAWGHDTIFIPRTLGSKDNTKNLTLAELDQWAKLQESHRGRAFHLMQAITKAYLLPTITYQMWTT